MAVTSSKNIRFTEEIQPTSICAKNPVLSCCAIAREKIETGDFDAGCAILAPWWKHGEWPNQKDLDPLAAAELLLTAGSLTDSVARAKRIVGGQRLAEALISGAVALFDLLGENTRAVEARIELGCCYYHQGLFEMAHSTLRLCVESLTNEDCELRAVALIRLAIVERHSGRLHEALRLLQQVSFLESVISQWTKGRYETEMANTLKEFGVAEDKKHYFDRALGHYKEASLQFEQIGNLRYRRLYFRVHTFQERLKKCLTMSSRSARFTSVL